MHKILRYFLISVLCLCTCVGIADKKAEAANIVVLPMINNVAYPNVESAYYNNVIGCIKEQDKYDLLDNDAVSAAIDKYIKKDMLPDEASIRDLAESTGADLVVVLELNKLSLEPVSYLMQDISRLELEGFAVTYNMELGKYDKHRFKTDENLEMGFYTRQDIAMRHWTNTVKREMHRALGNKKIRVEKPKFGKTF